MVNKIIALSAKFGPSKKERMNWISSRVILMWPDIDIRGSRVTRNLLKGWQDQSTKLRFNFQQCQLPRHLTIEQTVLLYFRDKEVSESQKMTRKMNPRRLLTNRSIRRLLDLTMPNNTWIAAGEIKDRIQSTRQVGNKEFSEFYYELTRNTTPKEMAMNQCTGWIWDWSGKPNRG